MQFDSGPGLHLRTRPVRVRASIDAMMSRVIDHYRAARNDLDNGPFATTEIVVRGVPMRVFAAAPPTLRSLWQLTAGHGGQDVHRLRRRATVRTPRSTPRCARWPTTCRETCGVDRGDRVAIAMRNYPEWVVAYWATVSIGAAVVGMNAWWTSTEMEFGLADSRPKVLIADDERLERALPVLDGLRSDGTAAC